jgi:hypothetical protein
LSAKTVKAVRDLGVNKGATGPHFMECSDGKTYLVKFADESKTAVNEYLGYALSHSLGIPVPPSALVKLVPELIAASDDLRHRDIIPGLHHGSEVVIDAEDFEELGKKQSGTDFEVLNFADIPGIICLDNWIMTRDRHRKDNHLLQPTQNGFRYFTVDFSHSFTGPNWTGDFLRQASSVRQPAPTSPIVESTITGLASVEPALKKIESTTDYEIVALVASVPNVWGLSEEERNSLASFLQTRRQIVREVVTTRLSAASPGT